MIIETAIINTETIMYKIKSIILLKQKTFYGDALFYFIFFLFHELDCQEKYID